MNTQTNDSIYLKIQELLEEYKCSTKKKQKKQIENFIVISMLPVIKKIAHSIARRVEDPIEDLIQAGSIGLIKAIEKYDSKKNNKFKIYAGYFIVGEMQHYMRDKVALIKVPQEIIELALRIRNFSKDLSDEQLELLTDEQVAQALDVPVQKVQSAVDYDRRKKVVSLDEVISGSENDTSIGDLTPSCDYQEYVKQYDTKLELEEIIENLPEDLKEIIYMFYYEDKKQKEIAQYLNINEMMVSRKLKKAYSLIHEQIKNMEYMD